ncbi:rhodanese-like domain-containing protein [Anabaena azotica]|uniref:Rhodanese-like domain-containing protein n=1 Tax=Anabaena azotica FACHB-119 TaxID=947527 RepID=A0ABR8D5P2_9NOST|nr:rhodanese-like domain-containing protein [Anabaena azotica]MBD2502227.1 rhodanese-like domain-containing protein [Anabaena azotica FACHB-119]
MVLNLIKYLISQKFGNINQITTAEFADWLLDGTKPQPLILDARSQVEYNISHIKAAVPIDPIAPDFTALLSSNNNKPIVVYCSVGYRSAKITQQLQNQGFSQVFNLSGGIFQWANEERPIFKDDTSPASFVHPYDAMWGNLLKAKYRWRSDRSSLSDI